MSLEIEIKLAITDEEAGKLRDCQLIKKLAVTSKSIIKQVKSDYFDTTDLYLARQGVALRIRQMGDKFYQTLKTSGQVKQGLHQRQEWEQEIANYALDLQLLPEQQANLFIGMENKLKPIFTTEFQRTIWILKIAEQTEVELVLDQGIIKSANQQQPISEIEIELKQGKPQALLSFAEELQNELILKPFDQSKAERGYQLYQKITEKQ